MNNKVGILDTFTSGYNYFYHSSCSDIHSLQDGKYCGYYTDGNYVQLEKINGKIRLNIDFSFSLKCSNNLLFWNILYDIMHCLTNIKSVNISNLSIENIFIFTDFVKKFEIEHISMSLKLEYHNEVLYEYIFTDLSNNNIIKSLSCDIHTDVGIKSLSKYLPRFKNLENLCMNQTLQNNNQNNNEAILSLFSSIKKLIHLKYIKIDISRKCNLYKEYIETLKDIKQLAYVTVKQYDFYDIAIPYGFDTDKIVCTNDNQIDWR